MKSNPFGIANGSMMPANIAQRWWKNLKSGEPHEMVIHMHLEHGGWHPETETDRILPRYIPAERCGLIVKVDEHGCAQNARWLLETGEVLYGERVIESVAFNDVVFKRLKQSTDLNLSSAKRIGVAGSAVGMAWWTAAEHLPAIGEVVLVLGVSAAFLAEDRVRLGIKWGDSNYAVGSIIAYGMNVIDAIASNAPIFSEGEKR